MQEDERVRAPERVSGKEMKPLLAGLMDRGLLKPVVEMFANVRGIDYETAHSRLCACAARIGWSPEEAYAINQLRAAGAYGSAHQAHEDHEADKRVPF